MAGGHGAPIMPGVEGDIYEEGDGTAYLNIGGISNISIRSIQLGFDIGPGNCLMLVLKQNCVVFFYSLCF